MRICLDLSPLMTSSRFRGHGSYALGLARALLAAPEALAGHELHFFTGEGRRLRVQPASAAVLRAITAGHDEPVPDTLYYALKHTLGRAALSLARIDLFHATDPKGVPRPLRCRVVATCHDLIPVILRYPFDPPVLPVAARALVERLRYRRFDHVIAISECTRRDLRAITGLPGERVSVVHHGVDTDHWSPRVVPGEQQRVRALLGGDRPYFLYIGGFDPRKQVPALVEGFARAARDCDEVLLLCGHLEPGQAAELERVARRAGIAPRILLPGYISPDDLPSLYRNATAHVMLSSYEGFGMTLTEALACGCPVLALRASCVPEIVDQAALLLDDASPEQVAGALVRLARDESLRATLRADALERAPLFSWARCAARTAEVYRRVLGGR